jgi:DNA-binding LytR/AlgR family response regulator
MPSPIRAILADDEKPLRDYLIRLLQQAWPDLEICAEARNGAEALALIQKQHPDIAFLDIKMPGLTGMEVARQAADLCHIVFVTAYDQFAVEAFENEAVDYLLKPVEPKRLALTVQRLRERIEKKTLDSAPIQAVLKNLQDHLGTVPATPYLKWIKVADKQTIRLVPVEDIACFQAQDKYTVVQTAREEFLIRKTIKSLTEELSPEMFWQIHRSTIVNAAWIDKVGTSLTGSYFLTLKNKEGILTVSRSYRDRFKSM